MNTTTDTRLQQKSDEGLAKLVQDESMSSGGHNAFAQLLDRYETKMTRYANKFLYTYEDRQDAVQDVFIKVYKNIQSFNTSKSFSPWIYRIAHNTFINHIKKSKHEKLGIFDADQFFAWQARDEHEASDREQKEEREVLNQSLAQLSAKYREPLVLYYFEQKNYKEIAEILELPVATVGVRLRRGRVKMREAYNIINNQHKHYE